MVKPHLKLAPVILTQLTRKATTHADINNKAAKKSKYPFFLRWTAIAMVDFFDLYRKKGDCICVIFSKSWFLKLPDKEMGNCETLKTMHQKGNYCFRGL